MNNIEVVVLNEAHTNPAGMQLFLAKLTQRGHKIQNASDLKALYNECIYPVKPRSSGAIQALAAMPHGTIKRFAPITIAIVGASRRFLAQARTNQVGIDYVSGSLQYSDYSDLASFVVPYPIIAADADNVCESCKIGPSLTEVYLNSCTKAMASYKLLADTTDNDTAGYVAPQGLRNILIMQGNHQSWDYFIRLRSCNRNTLETQYVSLLIWEQLLGTAAGKDLFAMAGADCVWGNCREGKMCCGHKLVDEAAKDEAEATWCSLPRAIIRTKFSALKCNQ